MGFRVSWIAHSGTSTQELLKISGRKLTGERVDFPDVGWYLLELADSERGPWVLLIADGTDNFADLNDSDAQKLSVGGYETLHFSCSDTVMVTSLVCFRNGSERWSIDYDCGNKDKRPEVNGQLPEVADKILKGLRVKQIEVNDADYIYDFTAELGLELTGFRHDTDLAVNDPAPFKVLGNPNQKIHPWWKFWNRN